MSKFTPIIDHFSISFHLDDGFPNSLKELKEKASELVDALQLMVVKEAYHVFEPWGITFVYILSQSHMAFHTRPENKMIHIDIVSCTGLKQEVVDRNVKRIFSKNKLSSYSIREFSEN